MLHILLIILPLTAAVSPMISMVRRIHYENAYTYAHRYASASPTLDCNICKEALYLTWGQSPSSIKEFANHIEHACHLATRHDIAKETICKTILHAHSEKLFQGNLHRGKEDCLMTGATDCEEVSKWSVHCDQRKKSCQVIPIH